MKLVVNRDLFSRALSRIQGVLSRKATLPVLSNVLLEVDAEGKLLFKPSVVLERSGLRLGVTSVLPDDVVGDCFRTLPARRAVRQQVKELRAAGVMLVVVLQKTLQKHC